MSLITINNISIKGIATAIPKDIILNTNEKFINTTGVHERRITKNNTCTSDLCEAAANDIIYNLNVCI